MCVRVGKLLTPGEAVPDLQAIVAAVDAGRRVGVGLQLKALKLQHDLRHLGSKDHEGAVQLVGILLWVAWGLDNSTVRGEVSGTFWT